ncbi:MAG TPA: hypothetical protein VFV98_01445 [Vicinamibacterales bacterium]|nr:hypothetical protein [Vicinamibacterales bacterium]
MIRSILVACLIALPAVATVVAQDKPKPSSPSVVAPPVWQLAITMPDGRTFVSDGALAVDAKIARPDAMPKKVLPVESGKTIAGRLTGKYADEIALSGLRSGPRTNTFLGPRDIPLNGNYVTFLRGVAPRSRLRFSGPLDPIVVMLDGQAVGLLMAIAMPK